MADYAAVPEELKNRDQWVTWKYIPDPKAPDKPKKLPFNPRTGKAADSTNAQTWASFEIAVRAAEQHRHDGVGFVFSKDDPAFGGDLDDCIADGSIAPWAKQIIDDMQTYTEISPSGGGVKFFGIGALPHSIKRFGAKIPEAIKPLDAPGGIELYSSGRFFTVTGRHLPGTPQTLHDVNGALDCLVATLIKEEEAERAEPRPRTYTEDTEYLYVWAERIIERAVQTLAQAPEGSLHDTRIAMGRLCGGLIPLGLATSNDLEQRLYAARTPSAHHTTERKAIRDGLAMGEQKALEQPEPPPQPHFDDEGYAVCPVHGTRLPAAKNGNGYKCHQRDASTATGWCDFWWKGKGYVEPAALGTASTSPIVGELVEPAPARRFILHSIDDLRLLPPVTWLVPHEVPASLLTVLCGPSEAGKSFLSLHAAMTVARACPDRAVIYVAPEGGSGYLKRCEAWLAHHGGEQPKNLLFVLRSVPMLDTLMVEDFITTVRSYNPILVIFDTLARCLVGGDENSAKDVGLFVENCNIIQRAIGAAVLIVHHTGKTGNYRGSSALYGAADSWIDFVNDDGFITVSCGKAKDWKPFEPRYLRMVERAESVVLLSADGVSQRGGKLTEGQRKVLEALAMDIFRGPGAKQTQIANATGINEKTLYRILSRLKRDFMIDQGRRGDPYTITMKGLDEIKAYHRALRAQRAEELAGDISVGGAEVSQLATNSHELSATTPPILSHSHSPFKGESERVREEEIGTEGDLFPDEETTPTEPLPPALLPPAERTSGFDLGYVRALFTAGNEAAILMHYRLNRRVDCRGKDNETILALARQEVGP